MSVQKNKVRLGPKELKILAYLELHGGSVWKEDIMNKFSWASKYEGVLARRLYRLQQKGLIIIKVEKNPDTGRQKQKVYLVK
jgi:DNA-binding PadR family transcriptional regulator